VKHLLVLLVLVLALVLAVLVLLARCSMAGAWRVGGWVPLLTREVGRIRGRWRAAGKKTGCEAVFLVRTHQPPPL
jgi:hypothetical protein